MENRLSASDKEMINKVLINDYLFTMRDSKIVGYTEDIFILLSDLADHLHGLYDERFDADYYVLLLENYSNFIVSQLIPALPANSFLVARCQKQIRLVKKFI